MLAYLSKNVGCEYFMLTFEFILSLTFCVIYMVVSQLSIKYLVTVGISIRFCNVFLTEPMETAITERY